MSHNTDSNIWQMQARGDVSGIIQALDSGDPQVRGRAVIALGIMGAIEALPKLRHMRDREYNPQRRMMMDQTILKLEKLAPPGSIPPPTHANTAANPNPPRFTGPLGKLVMPGAAKPDGGGDSAGNPQSEQASKVEALLRQTRGQNWPEVEQALLALGRLGDRSVVEHLVLMFRNMSLPAKVRLACAEALLMLESAPASVSLLAALRKPQSNVRRNAAAILGQLQADWAVEPLIAVMQSDSQTIVRKTAMAALRHIRTPEALQALRNLPPELKAMDTSPLG
jgi:hypothetical protein